MNEKVINDFTIFSFVEDGGCYEGGLNIFKSLLQGGFFVFQSVGIIVSVIAVLLSAGYLIVYSRKPKELAERVGLLGENIVTIIFIAGLVGIIVSVTQMKL